MAKTPAKLVKVEVAKRPGRWGGYRLKLTFASGAIRYQGDYEQRSLDLARIAARRLAREHGAELEL